MALSETGSRTGRERLLAAGGLLGGALSMSCCIVPLALVTLGVSGAWIGNLTALSPYQPVVLAATLALLATGFWSAYRRPGAPCEPGSLCERPTSNRRVKAMLWVAAAMIVASVSTGLLAPLIL